MRADDAARATKARHQPFPIADFTEGLQLDREPWLSPRNAFRSMNNARVFRGQLQKREGYARFADLCNDQSEQTYGPPTFTGAFTIFMTPTFPDRTARIVPESVRVEATNGPDPGGGPTVIEGVLDISSEVYWTAADGPHPFWGNSFNIWIYDVVASGTSTVIGSYQYRPFDAVDRQFCSVKWSDHPDWDADNDPGDIFYMRNSSRAVVGLTRFETPSGDFSLAMDRGLVYLYDTTSKFYVAQGKGASYSDYFTGADSDYFWTEPLDSYLVMTNGIDPVHRWDPTAAEDSAVSEQPTAWGGGGNELDTCRLILRYKGRLLYFRTTESASIFPGRVRWTAAGSFTTIDALDFADAPSRLGEIVTGGLIANRIFIGFEKGWMELVATGNENQPFTWEPFISRFGAVSKMSTLQDNERLLSRSDTTMQAIDPNGQYYIDQEIPDLVKDYNPDKLSLCASVRNEDQRAFWWSFVDANDETPNNALVATYNEQNELAWSEYSRFQFNVFSQFESNQTPSWDSLGPATWDDYSNLTWNEVRVGAAGFEQIIGGGESGFVYKFGIVNRDGLVNTGNMSIDMDCETQALSPYPGQRAHLGWVDIYAESVSGASFTISFYKDSDPAAYLSTNISLSGETTGAKVWRRIPVGKIGNFHRFKVESSSDRRVSIDALVPYFRPAGRIRVFN